MLVFGICIALKICTKLFEKVKKRRIFFGKRQQTFKDTNVCWLVNTIKKNKILWLPLTIITQHIIPGGKKVYNENKNFSVRCIFNTKKVVWDGVFDCGCHLKPGASLQMSFFCDCTTYLVSVSHWWNRLACLANSLRNLSFSSWRLASLANSPSRSSMIFCKLRQVSSRASMVNQV